MTKDNILFAVVGVLLGFIVGFFFANSVNQRAAAPRDNGDAASTAQAGLPPGHPDVNVNSVKEQQQQNLLPAAEDAAKRAREASGDFEAQRKAAELYYKADRLDEATEFLLRANQLKPDNLEVVVALGNINYDAGRYENAEKWYTAALVKQPDDINVRTDLGLTFFLREPPDIERALDEFRRSLKLDPNHEQTLQNMVVALTRKGEVAEAQAMYERLEKVSPNNPQLAKLRDGLEKARNSPAASSSAPAGGKGRK